MNALHDAIGSIWGDPRFYDAVRVSVELPRVNVRPVALDPSKWPEGTDFEEIES